MSFQRNSTDFFFRLDAELLKQLRLVEVGSTPGLHAIADSRGQSFLLLHREACRLKACWLCVCDASDNYAPPPWTSLPESNVLRRNWNVTSCEKDHR